MEEEKTLKEEIKDLAKTIEESKKPKEKKFRLPWKAKVGKLKLRKGFVVVEIINENRAIDFQKKQIIDGTININGDIHALDDLDLYYYKGKPFVHQPKGKINPWHPLKEFLNEERVYDGKVVTKNEIYGQKYVMARMKSDFITAKKTIGWGASIFGLVVLGIIAYSFITGG